MTEAVSYLLEGTLGEEVTLDAAQRLVGVVVRLLDQPELLPLDSVQPGVDAVVLLQPLQREDQELFRNMSAFHEVTESGNREGRRDGGRRVA